MNTTQTDKIVNTLAKNKIDHLIYYAAILRDDIRQRKTQGVVITPEQEQEEYVGLTRLIKEVLLSKDEDLYMPAVLRLEESGTLVSIDIELGTITIYVEGGHFTAQVMNHVTKSPHFSAFMEHLSQLNQHA